MRPQIDNKVVSSMLLWLDHTILDRGEAYTNVSGLFYKIGGIYNGYHTYALPFKQINADSSIPNANIMSGIYLNNVFITTGQSGFAAINYKEGQVYFSQNVDAYRLSGSYSIKDYNVYLTNQPEEKLLFETKYETRPKVTYSLTGLGPQTLTYPAIFLKNEGTYNEPFAFGGTDTTTYEIKAIIISDSQFSLDAVTSILRDRCRTFIPLLEESEMPFDSFGNSKNNNYNYNQLTQGKTNSIYISEVGVSRVAFRSEVMNEIKTLNTNIYPSFVNFTLEIVREPRA